MQGQMLAPAAVLVAWTLIMLLWAAGTRLPALARMGGLKNAKPGGRGQAPQNNVTLFQINDEGAESWQVGFRCGGEGPIFRRLVEPRSLA